VQFQSEDIAAALGACGPTGVSLANSALVLFGSKILAGGGIDASGHVSVAASLGVLYPQSLSVAHQGDATISYQAMLYNADDTADPFLLTIGAALPTITDFSKWTLLSAKLGGQTILQDVNVQIDFGVRCFGEGSNSNVRDQIVAIQSIEPKITVTSSKQGKILDLLGASGDCQLVLRPRAAGGGFGAGQIALAATRGLSMQETPFQAQGHRPGELSLQGHIYWDGTNAPLTFTQS
jgi:hypothetical protein